MSFTDFLCPRLIDYIAIVGLRRHVKCSQNKFDTPDLLRRYPQTDHDDDSLPSDIVHFCQPDGCFDSCSSRLNGRENHQFFVFTLTEKDTSIVRYGICVNFMRPIERKSPVRSPKQILSPNDSKSLRQMGSTSSGDMPVKEKKPNIDERKKRRNKPRTHSLTSLLFLTHHPFFKGFYQCLVVLKDIIESLDHRVKKRSNGKDSIWPYLLGYAVESPSSYSSSSASSNSMIYRDVAELETWIYRLLSTPVPVPGITKLELSLLPEPTVKPLVFALPDSERLPLADFPLHAIFELVGVEFALKLYFAALLENKVVLQSKNYGSLYLTIQAIQILFYPLEYLFTVTTLFPTSLPEAEHLFSLPSPFIIGVPSSFLSSRPKFSLSDEIMLFDIDEKMLLRRDNNGGFSESQIDEYLTLPPSSDMNVLVKHIKQALISISDASQPIKNFDDLPMPNQLSSTLLSNHQINPTKALPAMEITDFNPLIFGNDSDSVDVSTRVAMIRFLSSPNILGGFTRFTRVLKLYPKPIVAFQADNFVKSRKEQNQFVKKLATTQAVLSFAEWNIAPPNNVYFKILNRMLDPRLIGDKPKWYQQNLEPIRFNTHRENGSCTLHQQIRRKPPPHQFSRHNTDSVYDSSCSLTDDDIDDDEVNREYDDDDDLGDDNEEDSDGRRFSTSSHSSVSGFTTHKDPASVVLGTENGTNTDSGCSANAGGVSRPDNPSRIIVDISKVYNPPTYLQIPNISILDRRKHAAPIPPLPNYSTAPSSIIENGLDGVTPSGGSTSTTASTVVVQQQHQASLPSQNTADQSASHPAQLLPHSPIKKYFSDSEEVFLKREEHKSRKKHTHTSGDTNKEDQGSDKKQEIKNVSRSASPESSVLNDTKSKFMKFMGTLVGSSSTNSLSPKPSPRPSLVTDRSHLYTKTSGKSRSSLVRPENLANQIKMSHTATHNNGSRKGSASSTLFTRRVDGDSLHQDEADLIQITDDIKRGIKPGFMKQFQLQKLMIQESYRNLVLSRINMNIGNTSSNLPPGNEDSNELNNNGSDEFIKDVRIATEDQFEALVTMCRLIMNGVNSCYRSGNNTDGYGSVFVLMEMLFTHYLEIQDQPLSKISLPSSTVQTPTMSEYIARDTASSSTTNIINSISSLRISGEDYENVEIIPKNIITSPDTRNQEVFTDTSAHSIQSPNSVISNQFNFHSNQVDSSNENSNKLKSSNNPIHPVNKRPMKLELDSVAMSPSRSDFQPHDTNYHYLEVGTGRLTSKIKVYNDFTLSTKGLDTQGYRFRLKKMVYTKAPELPNDQDSQPPSSYRRAHSVARSSPVQRKSQSTFSNSSPTATLARWLRPSAAPDHGVAGSPNKPLSTEQESRHRLYLYEKLVGGPSFKKTNQNSVWYKPAFWKDVFYDAVCQEREMIGLDLNAKDLLDRYGCLDETEKKQLESTEDELLGILLNNWVAFMVMMRVDCAQVRQQANNLVARSHIGLEQSENIRTLTEALVHLKGNAIDLRNNQSRRRVATSFQVYWCPPTAYSANQRGLSQSNSISSQSTSKHQQQQQLILAEVHTDCIVLRSVAGRILHRWWFERIIECRFKRYLVTIVSREISEVTTISFYCYKNHREFMDLIRKSCKSFKENLDSTSNVYHVTDEVTKVSGNLKITEEGISLVTEKAEWFVKLIYIRKCCTRKPDRFIIEIIDPNTKNVTYRIFKSSDYDKIAVCVMKQFSNLTSNRINKSIT